MAPSHTPAGVAVLPGTVARAAAAPLNEKMVVATAAATPTGVPPRPVARTMALAGAVALGAGVAPVGVAPVGVQRDGTGTGPLTAAVPQIGKPAAWEALLKADPTALAAVAEAMVQLEKIAADGTLSKEVRAKAEAKAAAVLSGNGPLVDAIKGAVGVSAVAEVQAKLEAAAGGEYGNVGAELKAVAAVWARAKVSADASFSVGVDGLEARAEAGAGVEAGARAEAAGMARFKDAEVNAVLGGQVLAKASAKVNADVKITMSSVFASAAVEAMAGVSAGIDGAVSLSLNGTPLVAVEGKLEVLLGAGIKLGGSFSFDRGTVTVSGQIAVALGLGASASLKATVDFSTLANAIEQLIDNGIATADKEALAPLLKDTDDGAGDAGDSADYGEDMAAAFLKGFGDYTKKKAKQGEHFVKQEKVQALIAKDYLRFLTKYGAAEVDDAIKAAAAATFEKDQVTKFEVKDGVITQFVVKDKVA